MRTHISLLDVTTMLRCEGWDEAKVIADWGNGGADYTLEDYVISYHALPNLPNDPDLDLIYIFIYLMTSVERLRYNWLILNRLEKAKTYPKLRTELNNMKNFLEGIITRSQLDIKQGQLKNFLDQNTGADTDLKRFRYRQLTAVYNLMTIGDTRKEAMQTTRLVLNHYPDATNAKFVNLAIKILKEEV